MSFFGFVGSRLDSYSWIRAFATSEQARKKRSFSGGNFARRARVSGRTVMVAVAIVEGLLATAKNEEKCHVSEQRAQKFASDKTAPSFAVSKRRPVIANRWWIVLYKKLLSKAGPIKVREPSLELGRAVNLIGLGVSEARNPSKLL